MRYLEVKKNSLTLKKLKIIIKYNKKNANCMHVRRKLSHINSHKQYLYGNQKKTKKIKEKTNSINKGKKKNHFQYTKQISNAKKRRKETN